MTAYHDEVAAYYDAEAHDFEARAGQNHVLEAMRREFRSVTCAYRPSKMLEIGYGPGLDMLWFADQPGVEVVHGVDLTPTFHEIVMAKARARDDDRVRPLLGSAEDVGDLLPTSSVDTVFVFFGALNTTDDLGHAAAQIASTLEPGGRAVLTFVNRWYLFEILWNLATLRPRKGLARLREVWGGYSPTRHLASSCRSSREVHRAFGPHLKRVERHGYSILHPAWYRAHWAPLGGWRHRILSRIDRVLDRTFLWRYGEYALYVYERPAITD